MTVPAAQSYEAWAVANDNCFAVVSCDGRVQNCGYEGVGNRQTATLAGTLSTYTTSPTSNQLDTIVTGSNTRSYGYLASGQTSSDTRNPSTAYVYNYNNVGRLASATLNGTQVASYLFNGAEQRTVKTTSTSTTHYVFDRFGHLLAEADGTTGIIQREYIWLDDVPLALVDETGASPVLYYIHTDHLGTSQKITDGSLNVVWDGVFDPFGNPASLIGTLTNNLRFPGQYFDAETAIHQNWNREYDPSIGRYVESDPIGLLSGVNTYAYALDSPTRLIDPDGTGIVGGILGGVVGGIAGAPEGGIGAIPGAIEGAEIGSALEDLLNSANQLPNESEKNCPDEDCEKLLRIDTDTCNGITRVRGGVAGARCHASATQRYAACLRGQPLPPLDVWNN